MNKKRGVIDHDSLRRLGIALLLLVTNLVHSAPDKPFFADHARGWFWYEDPEQDTLEETTPEEKHPSLAHNPTPHPKTARERLKAVQEQLAELKAKAILEPTPANVKAYQEMQLKIVNQSEAFSKAWVMNVYLHPTLDENIKNPSAQAARFVVYDTERKETERLISGLKSTYGLFYFYSGSCSYCTAFTPILKQFAATYGWDVMAISLDGTPIDTFNHWQPDNGLAAQWHVQTVPAVFAVNPKTGHVLPVAHGFTAIDVMEKRIVTLVNGDRS